VSVQVSGGQLDLSNKYISQLPIPNFANLKPSDLSKMIRTGLKITAGAIDRWSDVDDLILSIFD
jgi:hypothetical protein